MGLTCPACGKTNQTGTECARCGCDLSQLSDVVYAARAALAQAQSALRATEWPSALAWAERSWASVHSREAARAAFLAAAGLGQSAEVMFWHHRAMAADAASPAA